MNTFADEVAQEIRRESEFWSDLADLRAVGIRSTLLSEGHSADVQGPNLSEDTVARPLSSASIFAKAQDEESRDLAQQIAVFASLASKTDGAHQGAVHILSDLGNFPGLAKLESNGSTKLGLHVHMRSALLKEINSVEMAGKKISLTEFQLNVWKSLRSSNATAISAPTSAGRVFCCPRTPV